MVLAGLHFAGPGAVVLLEPVAFAELLLLLSSAAWLSAGPSSAAAGSSFASAAAVLVLPAASLGTGKQAVVETPAAQLGSGLAELRDSHETGHSHRKQSSNRLRWLGDHLHEMAFWSNVRSFLGYICL